MRIHSFVRTLLGGALALLTIAAISPPAWAEDDNPAPAAPTSRVESRSDDFRFGQNVDIPAGETSDRDIVAFGGNVDIAGTHHGDVVAFGGTVRVSGTQTGDVVVFGGGLKVSGSITGSMTVFGGGAHLDSTAVVDGDLSLLGGNLHREPGAVVHGGRVSIARPHLKGLAPFFGPPAGLVGLGLGLSLIGWLKSTLLTLLLGLLIVAVMPAQVEAAGVVLRERWLASLGWGFVAGLALVPLTLLLLVTCIGAVLPFALYQVAKYFGFTVLFAVIGEPLGRSLLRRDLTLVPAFLVGFVALTLVGLVVPVLPVWMIYGWVGVGCALMTRFGTLQPWLKRRASVPPPIVTPPESPLAPSAGVTEISAPTIHDVSETPREGE